MITKAQGRGHFWLLDFGQPQIGACRRMKSIINCSSTLVQYEGEEQSLQCVLHRCGAASISS